MTLRIKELAEIAGISTRTLRYYDEIGLLKPAGISEAGYREYAANQVDQLQQIMIYRALGLKLDVIKDILQQPDYDVLATLKEQQQAILNQRQQLTTMLATVDESIQAIEEEQPMTDKDKFNGLKQALVDENEAAFGAEVRQQYGDEEADAANAQLMGLSEAQFAEMKAVEQQLFAALKQGLLEKTPAVQQQITTLHTKWLKYTWTKYSVQAHRGLADMYLNDPRFEKYYDDASGVGATKLLHDSLESYLPVE